MRRSASIVALLLAALPAVARDAGDIEMIPPVPPDFTVNYGIGGELQTVADPIWDADSQEWVYVCTDSAGADVFFPDGLDGLTPAQLAGFGAITRTATETSGNALGMQGAFWDAFDSWFGSLSDEMWRGDKGDNGTNGVGGCAFTAHGIPNFGDGNLVSTNAMPSRCTWAIGFLNGLLEKARDELNPLQDMPPLRVFDGFGERIHGMYPDYEVDVYYKTLDFSGGQSEIADETGTLQINTCACVFDGTNIENRAGSAYDPIYGSCPPECTSMIYKRLQDRIDELRDLIGDPSGDDDDDDDTDPLPGGPPRPFDPPGGGSGDAGSGGGGGGGSPGSGGGGDDPGDNGPPFDIIIPPDNVHRNLPPNSATLNDTDLWRNFR